MKGYQLKITIKGSSPPIWRRVIVPEKISFDELDWVIEYLFGWTHSHLYSFQIPNERIYFSGPPEAGDGEAANEGIDSWFYEKAKINYTYDFGDDWEHTILVEKVLDYDKRYPQVVKYKGPNMIEDCGGLWGFYENIQYAEPFDMEAANNYFREQMELPVFESDDSEAAAFLEDGIDVQWEEVMKELHKSARQQKKSKESIPLEPEKSLTEVFSSYTKDDLTAIAKANGFPKPGRFKKGELVQWLKNSLLESGHMKKVLDRAEPEEVQLFLEAMEEKGAWADEVTVSLSPLLMYYCGYRENGLLTVPEDVEEKFRKIYDKKYRETLERKWELSAYCRSGIYLYGVISLEKMSEIYEYYEHKKIMPEELRNIVYMYPDSMEIAEEDYIIEKELEEENIYQYVLEVQEGLPWYLPESKEEFLKYGKAECQEPDENTEKMLEVISSELSLEIPNNYAAFYSIQDMIRANYEEEEIVESMMDICGQKGKAKKNRLQKAVEEMRKYTRTWDNRGFTEKELEEIREL